MDSVSRYHEKSLPSSNWTCGTCCGTIEFQWGKKFRAARLQTLPRAALLSICATRQPVGSNAPAVTAPRLAWSAQWGLRTRLRMMQLGSAQFFSEFFQFSPSTAFSVVCSVVASVYMPRGKSCLSISSDSTRQPLTSLGSGLRACHRRWPEGWLQQQDAPWRSIAV